jgi:hypothetical protein
VAAFPVVPAGAFRFGTSGRNIPDGPGLHTVNASLLHNWRIRERGKLQFRWEVFNALNRANFGLPNPNVNLVTGGAIANVGAARQMQFGLRYQF